MIHVCFGNVLVTNLWGSDLPSQLNISATGSERDQKRGQNEAKTRPENSFGTPSALAAVPPARQQVSIAGV